MTEGTFPKNTTDNVEIYASEYNNFRRNNTFFMRGNVTANKSTGYLTNTYCKLRIGSDIRYIIDYRGSTDARGKILTINPNVAGTVGWTQYASYITNYEYKDEYSVAGKETSPQNLFFKPDGTKMYIIGQQADNITEYDLSPAWDVTSASYVQQLSVSAKESVPTGLYFKPDGLKMYVTGTNGDTVDEYDLAVAWDISSATYLQEKSVNTQDATPQSIWFNDDGTVMFMLGSSNDKVYRYTLSTGWDISTLTYHSMTAVLLDDVPCGMCWNANGTRCYIVGTTYDTIYEYSVTSAWTLTGWALTGKTLLVQAKDGSPLGVYFAQAQNSIYIMGSANDTVYRFGTIKDPTDFYCDINIRDDDFAFATDEVVIGSVDSDGNVFMINAPRGKTLVETRILTTATTDVLFENLDLDADGHYEIEFNFLNSSGSSVAIRLYINQNQTSSNYHWNRITYDRSTLAGSSDNTYNLSPSIADNRECSGNIKIKRGVSGYIYFYGEFGIILPASYPSHSIILNGNYKQNANVTSLIFYTNYNMAVGSKISLYKIFE